MSHSFPKLESVDSIVESLATAGYICNEQIATVVYLAAALEKPILVEGPPGVGNCLLYTSPSPRDGLLSRMPSSA